jgi:hypothetical protein
MAIGVFPANAELTFKTSTGVLYTDPATGNIKLQKADLVCTAYLKAQSRPDADDAPGVDRTIERLEGRMVDPIALPLNIRSGGVCRAIVDKKPGTLRLFIGTQSAFGVHEILGEKIYCEWRPDPMRDYQPVTGTPTPPNVDDAESPIYTASAALSALRVVAVNAGGALVYASANNADHAFGTIGLLTAAVADGAIARPLTEGHWLDTSWSWTPRAPIFLGVDGLLTQAVPVRGTAQFILQVAQAVTATRIDFEIQEPVLFG